MSRRTSHPNRPRRPRWAAVITISLIVVVLGLAGVAVATALTSGEVGPSLRLTANGRLLHPLGRQTVVGNFPTGSARRAPVVEPCGSPTAAMARTTSKSSTSSSGKVIQTLPLPGCYGGIAFAPNGARGLRRGTPKGSSPTEGPTKGDQGDVLHVFTVDPHDRSRHRARPIQLPATTGGSGRLNSLPPVSGVGTAQPEGSPPRRTAATSSSRSTPQTRRSSSICAPDAEHLVHVGAYPNGVAFDPKGRAYVSNEYSGTLIVIDPASAKVVASIGGLGGSLGDLGEPSGGMVADPKRPYAVRRGHEPRPRRGRQHELAHGHAAHLSRADAGARHRADQARDLPG